MLLSLNPNTPSYVRNISNSNIHPKIKKYCGTVRFRNEQEKTVKASMKPYIIYTQTYSTHIHRPAKSVRYLPDYIFIFLKRF